MVINLNGNEYWSRKSGQVGAQLANGAVVVDPQGVEDCNCEWNLIISGRDIGKSYDMKCMIIDTWCETGKGFAIVKRWQDDIRTDFTDSYFSDMVDYYTPKFHEKFPGFEGFSVNAFRGNFNVYGYYEDGRKENLGSLGHAFALSMSARYKSQAWPQFAGLIEEEFISEDGRMLANEFDKLLSIISTIRRDKEFFRIYLLGNTLDPNHDFFHEMKIDTNLLKQGEIRRFDYYDDSGNVINSVAFEWVRELKKKEETQNWAKFNRPEESMLIAGNWQSKEYRKLESSLINHRMPKIAVHVDYHYISLYCYIFQNKDSSYFMTISKKRLLNSVKYINLYEGQTNLKRMCFNLKSNLATVNNLKSFIYTLYNDDLIYYENNLCGLDLDKIIDLFI